MANCRILLALSVADLEEMINEHFQSGYILRGDMIVSEELEYEIDEKGKRTDKGYITVYYQMMLG